MSTLSKPARKLAIDKMRETAANRLIPRLARYLGDDSLYGKSKIRKTLRKGGYKGPKWKDEARAVKVLMEAGHDMAGFERQSSRVIPSLASQTVTSPAPVKGDLADQLKSVTLYLMQGRKAIFREDFDETAACLLLALSKARK